MFTELMPATHTVVSLTGTSWVQGGRKATFAAQRSGFGVVEVATGRLLSKDGEAPASWDRKATAAVIAEYPPAWGTVEVVA